MRKRVSRSVIARRGYANLERSFAEKKLVETRHERVPSTAFPIDTAEVRASMSAPKC